MKWYKNLKLKYKLLTAFMCLIIFIGISGFFGLRNIRKINENSQNMVKSNINMVAITKDNQLLYEKTIANMVVLIGMQILIALLVSFKLSKYILDKISKNVKFSEEIAVGQFENAIVIDSNDEFGTLGNALNSAASNTKKLMDDLQKSKEKLKENEERYRLAIEGTNDGIWDIDLNNNKIYVSNRCKDILELECEMNLLTTDEWKNKTYINTCLDKSILNKIMSPDSPKYYREFIVNSKNGEEKIILSRGKAVFDEYGDLFRIIGSVTDVSGERKADKLAKYIAYNDKLTGLPNRLSYKENVTVILNAIKDNAVGTLLFINIDNFKSINEIYGHEIGDVLIKLSSVRIKTMVNEYDTIYYMNGDNFAIFTLRLSDKSEIEQYAKHLMSAFKESFLIENRIIYITCSIGISLFPDNTQDFEGLLKNSDMALRHAKLEGKNTYKFYNDDMRNEILDKMVLQNELKEALINKEFVLHYQPKYETVSSKINGMEALVRWKHPTKGLIMPGKFIAAAEETGLITDIGEFVLREACRQNKEWQEKGFKPLRVAVNISVEQLQKDNFIDLVRSILDETHLEPKWLELEVTESGIIKNFETSIKKLNKIRELGVYVTLDDFGTGYSSLNYLISLPIGTIKIDKSFIDNITKNEKDKFVAHSLIKMAQGIKLDVVAEGVETLEQLNILKDYKCNIIQGYIFSKPLDNYSFEQLIQ